MEGLCSSSIFLSLPPCLLLPCHLVVCFLLDSSPVVRVSLALFVRLDESNELARRPTPLWSLEKLARREAVGRGHAPQRCGPRSARTCMDSLSAGSAMAAEVRILVGYKDLRRLEASSPGSELGRPVSARAEIKAGRSEDELRWCARAGAELASRWTSVCSQVAVLFQNHRKTEEQLAIHSAPPAASHSLALRRRNRLRGHARSSRGPRRLPACASSPLTATPTRSPSPRFSAAWTLDWRAYQIQARIRHAAAV